MRAGRTLRVLAILLAALTLPALAVRATHNPQVADVVAVATNTTYNMSCPATATEVDCTAYDPDQTWSEYATIKPATGDLTALSTLAAVNPAYAAPLYSFFQQWMYDLHTVACAPTRTAAGQLSTFVSNVGALKSTGVVTPLTITGECNLTGGLNVILNIDGLPSEYDYWINASVIPPATPTPSPTPSPTPKPTASPTAKPNPTATATPTPRATASPTAQQTSTASPTSSPTASPTATATASATSSATATVIASAPSTSPSPEQGVSGATGTPGERPGREGWANTVPSPDKVSTRLGDIGGSLALAIVLILVMAFPGELFNNTFQANYDEIAGWFGWKKKS